MERLSADLGRLVRETMPAVASVEHKRGKGSGVVVAPDGYVLTNRHVVGGARRVKVRLGPGDEAWEAEVVGTDRGTDLAVLRIAASGLAALPLRDDAAVDVGELVVAIGNPMSLERSVSFGMVSALDRTLPMGKRRMLEGLIQTDAAVNPGNSGGPVVDARGRAVGVTVAVHRYAQGIGFAIPARTACWVVGELIRRGRIERELALGN